MRKPVFLLAAVVVGMSWANLEETTPKVGGAGEGPRLAIGTDGGPRHSVGSDVGGPRLAIGVGEGPRALGGSDGPRLAVGGDGGPQLTHGGGGGDPAAVAFGEGGGPKLRKGGGSGPRGLSKASAVGPRPPFSVEVSRGGDGGPKFAGSEAPRLALGEGGGGPRWGSTWVNHRSGCTWWTMM